MLVSLLMLMVAVYIYLRAGCMGFETLTVSFGRTRIPSALTGHTSDIQDLRVLAQVYRLVKRHNSLCATVRTNLIQ